MLPPELLPPVTPPVVAKPPVVATPPVLVVPPVVNVPPVAPPVPKPPVVADVPPVRVVPPVAAPPDAVPPVPGPGSPPSALQARSTGMTTLASSQRDSLLIRDVMTDQQLVIAIFLEDQSLQLTILIPTGVDWRALAEKFVPTAVFDKYSN
jgi:hypothetical protein